MLPHQGIDDTKHGMPHTKVRVQIELSTWHSIGLHDFPGIHPQDNSGVHSAAAYSGILDHQESNSKIVSSAEPGVEPIARQRQAIVNSKLWVFLMACIFIFNISLHLPWMGLPLTPRMTSISVSEIVGCAWIMPPISSGNSSADFASSSSCNSTVALCPTMCAPSISSFFGWHNTLTRPVGLPTAMVLPALW
jgi:hypothetical protein